MYGRTPEIHEYMKSTSHFYRQADEHTNGPPPIKDEVASCSVKYSIIIKKLYYDYVNVTYTGFCGMCIVTD